MGTIVEQHRAADRKATAARQPGGERSHEAEAPPSRLLALQQTAGNRAVTRLIQRAPWQNQPADFRTDNETGGAVSRSEYSVDETGYRRYAPINKYRGPGQIFHDASRSFAYLPKTADQDAAENATSARLVGADEILLFSRAGPVRAQRKPQNGLKVWDADVTDADAFGRGTVGGRHVGHVVEDLGKPLPTLGNAKKLQKARRRQDFLKAAQAAGTVPSDQALKDYWMNLPADWDMATVIDDLRHHRQIGTPVRNEWNRA